MCSELSLPLSRKRNAQDQKILSEKLESMQLGLEYNDEGTIIVHSLVPDKYNFDLSYLLFKVAVSVTLQRRS